MMKKTLILLALFGTTLSLAAKNQGKELHNLLLSYMQVEDVHPDSMESCIADLKQRRLQMQDPAQRAVYAAAIARFYSERRHTRSVGSDMRDSAVCWYGRALAEKTLLADTKAKKWKRFVVIGKDESYFDGDMLNVVWRSVTECLERSVRDTARVLPRWADIVDFYQKRDMRSAALLMAVDSLLDNPKDTYKTLQQMSVEYADLPLCAHVYLFMAQSVDLTPSQKREILQQGLDKYPKYKNRRALKNALNSLSDPLLSWSGPSQVYPGKQYKWYFSARNVHSVSIDGKEHVFADHDPVETFKDSMLWTAPKPGNYTLTFVPHLKVKTERKVSPIKEQLSISALQLVYQLMPDGRVRFLVLDSETGTPRPGVNITVFRPDRKDTVEYFTGKTDDEGFLMAPRWKSENSSRYHSQMRVQMSTPEEQHLPMTKIYVWDNVEWKGAPVNSTFRLRLFTERRIYRPGQTVHVSGLAYNQLDWSSRVCAGRQYDLDLLDSKFKVVETKSITTDEMGVFSTDFVLPTNARNGNFQLRIADKASMYFRVEEYKRPTFEVTFDDSLRVQGDSCLVRGKAMTYDGTPLRGARVTGTYEWETPWLYRGRRTKSLPLDTIETDEQGRFQYRLAREERRNLFVGVDVLSQQGETHSMQHLYWNVRDWKPKPEPDSSIEVDSTFLVTCEVDTFDIGKPGRISVSTKLSDVHLYYLLSAAGEVWTDTLVHLSRGTYTFEIPYRKEYDQSMTATFCAVRHGNVYIETKTIYLARPDNKLRLHWDTFRDLLQPGQQEEWRLTLRRPDGSPANANLMVTMYDASLDYFDTHRWPFDVYRTHRTYNIPFEWGHKPSSNSSFHEWYIQKRKKSPNLTFSFVDGEQFRVPVYSRAFEERALGAVPARMLAVAAPSKNYQALEDGVAENEALSGRIAGLSMEKEADTATEAAEEGSGEKAQPLSVPMRENFDETAFFYPQLRSDAQGNVSISFTLPESLTRWKLLGVAHTKDLMYATVEKQIEARKDLMAQLYLPRFLRQGDETQIVASVRNVGDIRQEGKGTLQIMDARTNKVLKTWTTTVGLDAQQDTVLTFDYAEPQADVVVKWAVEGQTCSDGEQRLLPVLAPTMHVTNTLQITAYNPSTQKLDLRSLFPDDVEQGMLTLEYTTRPEQYALQALPALAKAKHNDVLSLASAYYAGVLGKELGVEMPDSTEEYLSRMTDLQTSSGGFRWYPDMPASPYLTREVSYLLTRLRMLTGQRKGMTVNDKAVHYLLAQPIDSTYLSDANLRNLYIAQYSGVELSKEEKKKVDFMMKLAKRDNVKEEGYERLALLSIVLKQAGADRKAKKCMNEFRKYIVTSPERGSYIEFPKGSFSSIDRKLHIHVQLMEALQRMNPADTLLRGMRRYLLQQKRTQEWNTPINTANAVFALMYGQNERNDSPAKDLLTLTSNKKSVKNFAAKDDTLGYLCDSVEVDARNRPVALRLHKFSKGESWGGVYADFEQPYSKVTAHETGLSVRCTYPAKVTKGTRCRVQYRISADRDYEYVTLVLPRPSAFEPARPVSGYRWNGRLGYYQQVHDATIELSFHQIPRGDYLIEEDYYVERTGKYHTGVSVIRCEYAEEFQGHSADDLIEIGQ